MNRANVALKIFYRTLALFLIIVLLQVVFFSFFFESFHENRRIDTMQEEIGAVSTTVESSAAGQMDAILGRFGEEEGVYTEAIDLSSETVFSVGESDSFNLAGRTIVMPPYVGRAVYTDAFEVGSNVERVRIVPHESEAVYFPTEIVIGGVTHTYDIEDDLLNLSGVFDLDAAPETYQDRLITEVDKSTERFASLHQLVIGYLIDEDITTETFREDGLEGEYFKTDNAFGDYYVFITPLTVNNEAHTLFTVMPVEPVYTFIGDVLMFLGFTAIITLALLAGLTYLNARSIARPLRELSSGVGRIANLDFTPVDEPAGNDEIATLARNINTMRGNLEEAMARLNTQNARLKESLERENAHDRDRKDFIASLSHEMKTPLSVIEASSEALRDGIFETEKERCEQLELIQKEIQKSKSLIEGIMDTYKIDRPSYLQSFKPLDLADLVRRTYEDNRPIFEKHGVAFDIKGGDAMIEGDSEKLTLALSNLLTNAARNTEAGGTLTVTIEKTDHNSVSLTMENTPASMDEALIKAFDEQTTLNQSTNTGGGVGLHIVRLVLEQHKAEARFENTEDGVRFTATFKSA